MPLVPVLDPHRFVSWAPVVGDSLRVALRWASQQTGLPLILVAAIALVVSMRAARRSMRFAIEVVVAVGVLVVATRFGWITW